MMSLGVCITGVDKRLGVVVENLMRDLQYAQASRPGHVRGCSREMDRASLAWPDEPRVEARPQPTDIGRRYCGKRPTDGWRRRLVRATKSARRIRRAT